VTPSRGRVASPPTHDCLLAQALSRDTPSSSLVVASDERVSEPSIARYRLRPVLPCFRYTTANGIRSSSVRPRSISHWRYQGSSLAACSCAGVSGSAGSESSASRRARAIKAPALGLVHLDEQPPGPAHGTDVDDQGSGTLTDPRLYQLLRQPGPVSERTLEVTFLDPGVQAYAFTFG
jgi:hypothetical protein